MLMITLAATTTETTMKAQRCVASRQAAFSGRSIAIRPQRVSRSAVAVKVRYLGAVHVVAIVAPAHLNREDPASSAAQS